MKLSELKTALQNKNSIVFQLPQGTFVPAYAHVTEIGHIAKSFIDCGGTMRKEDKISIQLWDGNDTDHRLAPEKLINIIDLSVDKLNIPDAEIEVEYQGESIQKFGLDQQGDVFLLTNKETCCLAPDQCGITDKPKINLSDLTAKTQCDPNSGCC